MPESNWLTKRLAAIRTPKQRSGDAAEERALVYLQAQGLQLVQRSFLCKGGEIDLIMRDAGFLVFVEVRQRADARFGGAIASVTAAKQKRLIHAAQIYLQGLRTQPPCRFDLVAIEGEQLQWLKNIISA
ncbi:YraN family protein [Undibacterium sp. LX40W]|uniref:UPF0102 protein H8K36_10000 n=1 Tax=Undibacterium nitidum TaxID=2762298 RepID=A0A923HR14_9BURK|nr:MULTISPECIES: YraN family protein [Undibacterium]MBC3881705.1 YraN family protein [Undibacterium nitidum]MBC3892298.1 YraN family protein [Undibacterium sp. LX40W]